MTILAACSADNTTAARFRTPPWHDSHPAKLDIELSLPPDHLARTIDRALSHLDLSALHATYGGTGSDAHPPERLLAVVLYEMQRGHHHPAEWHQDARECNPVRWLLRGCQVSRSCWYSFRDRLAPLLLDLNRQALALGLDAGLTPATRAAADGTLIAANASRHKVVTPATLEKRAEQLAAACAEDLRLAAAASRPAAPAGTADGTAPVADAVSLPAVPAGVQDAPALVVATQPSVPVVPQGPAVTPLAVPAWLATSVAGRLQQQQRLEQAQQRLEELLANNQKKWASKRKDPQAIVVSLSDPEAAVGRDKEKVFRPLYNVQIVADLDSPLILAYEVFAQQNDAGLLGLMLTRVEQQVGHGLEVMLSDAAYAGGADLAAAAAKGVTVYAPVPGDGVTNPKQIPKREFVWQAEEETYVCPQGHRLEYEESWKEKRVGGGVQVWRYRCPPAHCLECPVQARCTRTPSSGRAVTRQEHEELIEGLRERMATAEGKALYRLRGQNVELVNADWKEHRKLRRFSGRGLKRVRCEVGLIVLAQNLVTVLAEPKKRPARLPLPVVANPAANAT